MKVIRLARRFILNIYYLLLTPFDNTSYRNRSKMGLDQKFVNVIMLGFGFMFVFTAFQTMGNIEKTILDSIRADVPGFLGDGYTSLAVIYASLAVCNWLAPSAISIIGSKWAMVSGAVVYCLFIATFLVPQTWLLYLASVLLGIGAALIWCGQGGYLADNSDSETIARNSGLFWAMLQASLFIGNLFVYIKFQGKNHIDLATRNLVFYILVSVCIVGIGFLAVLRKNKPNPEPEDSGYSDGKSQRLTQSGPMAAFKGAFALFCTKDMMLLSLTFIYTGIELSFFSGVYSPSIGFTLNLGENAKQLVGLSGVFIGVGEVLGGALFGLLGHKTIKHGRDPIVILGYLVHTASFFLIYINLPNDSPFGDTTSESYIGPYSSIAMLCSFMLGFGDACYNTQIYSILGGVYQDKSTSAFALFKFTQSLATAVCFFYSSHIVLRGQLIILIIFGTLSTLTFCYVEWKAKERLIRQAVEIKLGTEENIPNDGDIMP